MRTITGVPAKVWHLFVIQADAVRLSGREYYSARTIAEYLRHHRQIERGEREFIVNNNWVPVMARAYMDLRGCLGFFETREKRAA